MKGKTVLITGASGNLGGNLALHFARMGANIIITSRNTEKLIPLENKIKEIGANSISVTLDTCIPQDCKNAVAKGIEYFGSIDFLINNASGYLITEDLREASVEEINTEINTTYRGPILMSKAILDHFIQNKKGTIINVSSISGLPNNNSNAVLYNSDKSAVIKFSETMSNNLSKYNIRVSCVIPCSIRHDNFSEEHAVSYDDVSKVILFQCSEFDNLNMQSIILAPQYIK